MKNYLDRLSTTKIGRPPVICNIHYIKSVLYMHGTKYDENIIIYEFLIVDLE